MHRETANTTIVVKASPYESACTSSTHRPKIKAKKERARTAKPCLIVLLSISIVFKVNTAQSQIDRYREREMIVDGIEDEEKWVAEGIAAVQHNAFFMHRALVTFSSNPLTPKFRSDSAFLNVNFDRISRIQTI